MVVGPGTDHTRGVIVLFGFLGPALDSVPLEGIVQRSLQKSHPIRLSIVNRHDVLNDNPMKYVLGLYAILSHAEAVDIAGTMQDLQEDGRPLVGGAVYEMHVMDALVPENVRGPSLWQPFFSETASSMARESDGWSFLRYP